MIPKKSAVGVEGSMPVAGRRMSFDENSIAHIMRLLIDLYTDSELAIIRELSTNAIDSHIMAGVTTPIEIVTPSPLSPYFKVIDHGLGLTVDELYNLFGKYGASTKRDTNEATGMLGLGSKSPLTYTNQFTMTAIKDGVRATVSISRDEDGVGNLTVVDTSATTDPNGVEIVIPAKTGNNIERKAQNFFKFWKSGTITLNGSDPTGLGDDAMWVTDTIALIQDVSLTLSGGRLVMGNVPYPCEALSSTSLGLPNGYAVVAYVPIGSVEFAPSREGLMDVTSTRNTIAKVTAEFRAGLHKAVQDEIDQAASAPSALKKVQQWARIVSPPNMRNSATPTFTWQGKLLPTTISTPSRTAQTRYGTPTTELTARTLHVDKWYSGRGRSGAASNMPYIHLDAILTSVFVTDFDPADVTLTHRKKATQWLDKQALEGSPRQLLFLDWKPDVLDFVDQKRIVSWATIKAEKLPQNTGGASGRIPGSYDLVLGGKNNQTPGGYPTTKPGTPGDQIDQTKPVFYIHGNVRDASYRVVSILDHFHNAYTLICLPENRLAKFRRENPKIQNGADEIKRLAEQIAKKMTSDEKIALAMNRAYAKGDLANLAPHARNIDDPDVKDAIRIAQINVKHVLKSQEQFRGEFRFESAKWTNPLDSYLLYDTTSMRHNADHVIRYLNNEYAARKAAKP